MRRSPTYSLVALIGALALMLLAGGAAEASEETTEKERARSRLREGVAALQTREYASALARFQEAHALHPSAKIFFDFALAHEGLGQAARAIDWLDRFLAEATDANPAERERARRLRALLLERVSAVEIISPVPDVEIQIDGTPRGRAPLPGPIQLDPGRHVVTVRRPAGGAPFETELETVAGTPASLRIVFLEEAPTPAPPRGVAPDVPPSLQIVTPPPLPPKRSRLRAAAPWMAGAAAVLLAGATTFQFLADARARESRQITEPSRCDRVLPDQGGARCAALIADYDLFHRLGIGGFVVGGALALTSAVFYTQF